MYAYTTVCILKKIEKNAPKPNGPPPPPPAHLLRFFVQLLPRRALLQLPALKALTFYERLFTPLVTLWYLLFQWLQQDRTLDAVVADARAGGADRLHRKLACQMRSASTASYSDARQRLPEEFLTQALHLQGRQITQQSPATVWKTRVVALLDGTTVRLRSQGDIAEVFPPQGNQHQKRTYWCLMRVAVTFCCFTGAALDCALGSMHRSEQALACEIILRAAGRCLFIGDRNFGVFRVVQAARQAGQDVLLRMTDTRAAKLLGHAPRVGDFSFAWKPTRRDQLPAEGSRQPVPGRMIIWRLERPGFRSQWLCLFTTLTDPIAYPSEELTQLYGRRWHAELDLRYVKDQMKAAQLEVHSAAMARKQWLACLLAYNLVRAAMLCAALGQNVSPLTLSFSAARRRLEIWLLHFGRTLASGLACWSKALEQIAQCQLPKRTQPRPTEPRAKRYIRESFPPLIGPRAQARKKIQSNT
jgi:hypothetical protein